MAAAGSRFTMSRCKRMGYALTLTFGLFTSRLVPVPHCPYSFQPHAYSSLLGAPALEPGLPLAGDTTGLTLSLLLLLPAVMGRRGLRLGATGRRRAEVEGRAGALEDCRSDTRRSDAARRGPAAVLLPGYLHKTEGVCKRETNIFFDQEECTRTRIECRHGQRSLLTCTLGLAAPQCTKCLQAPRGQVTMSDSVSGCCGAETATAFLKIACSI